ncbi:hypothetical protein ACFVS2_20200 [Brevibacillus sp. NPDC058079]|uniref:hypothetical protein n=1 Tax=Brevibacillus sp. NPDC058079 TaxID=3346330 RepID=UPI0036E8369A
MGVLSRNHFVIIVLMGILIFSGSYLSYFNNEVLGIDESLLKSMYHFMLIIISVVPLIYYQVKRKEVDKKLAEMHTEAKANDFPSVLINSIEQIIERSENRKRSVIRFVTFVIAFNCINFATYMVIYLL